MRIQIYRNKVIPLICIIMVIILNLKITPESPYSVIFNNNIRNNSITTTTVNNNINTQYINNNISNNIISAVSTNSNITSRQYRYNNNYTTLMSYYPISMYPPGSRNGIYVYPYREGKVGLNKNINVEGVNNNNILYNNFITESSVERVSSLSHPACLAEDIIHIFRRDNNNNEVNSRSSHKTANSYNSYNSESKDVDDMNQWHKYTNRKMQCYKAGGLTPPGVKRRGGNDEDETLLGKNKNHEFSHIILRNIIYSMGEFYYIEPPPHNPKYPNGNTSTEEAENRYITLSYASSFTAVRGSWPQRLVDTITLRRVILNKNQLYPNGNNDTHHLSMQTAVTQFKRYLKHLNDPQGSNSNVNKTSTDKVTSKSTTRVSAEKGNNNTIVHDVPPSPQPLHLHVPIAYWQPPTDYVSNFHSAIEVTSTALHSLITAVKRTSLTNELFTMNSQNIGGAFYGTRENVNIFLSIDDSNNKYCNTAVGHDEASDSDQNPNIFSNKNCDARRFHKGESLLLPPTLLITSRVRRTSQYKVIRMSNSCGDIPNTTENHDLISPINDNKSNITYYNINCINTPLGRMEQAVMGTAGVYGLQNHHAQVLLSSNIGDKNPRKKKHKKSHLSNEDTRGHEDIFFIDRLLVGNPTHCEIVWGSDAYYVEAVAQDQFLRGKENTTRIAISLRKDNLTSKISPQDELVHQKIKQFFDVYRECQLFLWEYRNFFLKKISVGGDISRKNDRLKVGRRTTSSTVSETSNKQTTFKTGGPLIATSRGESTNESFSSNDNNSYISTSAVHGDIRMLPIIPPVYSDSVTPINNNNYKNYNNLNSKDCDGIHIVIASRKGDWAREFNDEEIAYSIRKHFKNKAEDLVKNQQEGNSQNNNNNNGNISHDRKQLKRLSIAQQAMYESATVRVVKFTGKKGLRHKLLHQLAVPKTTIFIGNHGASLIQSVFLRPNSGVITLSFGTLGFYPFPVFPRWLHWRDMSIDERCNKRLSKGLRKCRWWVQNRNDMFATREQIARIVEFVDEIIADQIDRPKDFSPG